MSKQKIFSHSFVIAVICVSVFFFDGVSAHNEGGTIEKIQGNYFVDIGYSEGVIRTGKPVRFDFILQRASDRSDVEFDEVYLKVTKSNNIFYVMTLTRPAAGSAGITLTFPSAGEYKFDVSYLNNKNNVLATDFLLNVQESESDRQGIAQKTKHPLVSFTLGLIIGLLIQFSISRLK